MYTEDELSSWKISDPNNKVVLWAIKHKIMLLLWAWVEKYNVCGSAPGMLRHHLLKGGIMGGTLGDGRRQYVRWK